MPPLTATTKRRPVTIVAPQDLVHVAHTMTLRQYKYWLLLLREYRDQVLAGDPPSAYGLRVLRLSRLKEHMGYEVCKRELRHDLRALKGTALVANLLSKNGRPLSYEAGLVSEFIVTSSRVAFKLPSLVENFIEDVNVRGAMFQAIDWHLFNSFSGKYEAILYKLCRDYQGVRRTPQIPIKEFRDYLGLGSKGYPEFKALNQSVIAPAVAAINASTTCDISIEPHFTKEGRAVASIAFIVKTRRRSEKSPPAMTSNGAATTLSDGSLLLNMEVTPAPAKPVVLKIGAAARGAADPNVPFSRDLKFRFTQPVIDKACESIIAALDADEREGDCFADASVLIDAATRKQYRSLLSDEAIAMCIERANSYAIETADRTGKRVLNMGGLYRTAITEGWHLPIQAEQKAKKAQAVASRAAAAAAAAVAIATAEKDRSVADDIERTIAQFDLLPDDQKAALRAGFRATLSTASLVRLFERSHEQTTILRGSFADYLRASAR